MLADQIAFLEGVENNATRVAQQVRDVVASGDRGAWDDLVAADVQRVDRRSGARFPDVVGRNEYWRSFTEAVRLGLGSFRIEPLAVRGDDLAVVDSLAVTESGLEVAAIQLVSLDSHGRFGRAVLFDHDDLNSAIEELGALAAQAAGLAGGTDGDFFSAINRRDWSGLEAQLASDFTIVDHQILGWPDSDRASFLDRVRHLVAAGPDIVVWSPLVYDFSPTTRCAVTVGVAGVDGGGATLWHNVYVVTTVDGLINRMELFDLDDIEAARQRHESLRSH